MLLAGTVSAQVPGDGIPDLYYFPADGLTVATSEGDLSLPAGWLTIDTDGNDMVALLVSGPDAEPQLGAGTGCDKATGLCDGGSLPDPLAPPFNISSWSFGRSAGSNQWIRGNPLNTTGFQGIVGEPYGDGDPFDLYPDTGLVNLGAGLTEADFPLIFNSDGGEGGSRNAVFANNAGDDLGLLVTVVPEPSALGLLSLAGLAFAGLRRRS